VQGETVTIHFTVIDDKDSGNGNRDARVLVETYPNPVTSSATVEVVAEQDAEVSIELQNESGQVVKRRWSRQQRGRLL